MYTPKHFKVTDKKKMYEFVEANAFGQLISNVDGKLFSTHLPFLLSEDKTKLIAHLASQNQQVQQINDQEVLVTLQGAHDYISPSWYTSPGVPTWNYQTIHLHGVCKTFKDSDMLKEAVDKLTSKYESKFETPWQTEYKVSMLSAIVGVEILITEWQCQFKLSQNRSGQDQKQVIEQLRSKGSHQMADVMKKEL